MCGFSGRRCPCCYCPGVLLLSGGTIFAVRPTAHVRPLLLPRRPCASMTSDSPSSSMLGFHQAMKPTDGARSQPRDNTGSRYHVWSIVDNMVCFFLTFFESISRVMHFSDCHDHPRNHGSAVCPRHEFVLIPRGHAFAHEIHALERPRTNPHRIPPPLPPIRPSRWWPGMAAASCGQL